MKKSIENLSYILGVVDDLFDATDGNAFPGIDNNELMDAFILVENILERPVEHAPLSFKILSSMLRLMADFEISTGELSAADPNYIAQAAIDSFPSGTLSDQKENEIYDAVFNLASILVKDVGKYL